MIGPGELEQARRGIVDNAGAPHTVGLYSVASRNAVFAITARLVVVGIGLVLTPFVLDRVRAEMYGVVVVAHSIFNCLSLMRGGVGGALRWYVTLHHHGGRPELANAFYGAGFWWAAALRTAALATGLALAWPLTGFLQLDSALRPEAALGMGLIILASIVNDQGGFLNIPIWATGRTVAISLVDILGAFARALCIFAALSWVGTSLGVYGSALVVAECVMTVALLVIAQRAGTVSAAIPRPQLGHRELRAQIFRYGGWAIVSQAAVLLYLSADNLLIGRIYGTEQVTHYSLGARWAPLVQGFLLAAVSGLTPILTSLEARGESDRSRSAQMRAVGVTSGLAVAACLVPCVVGDLFLVHWVGAEYRASAQYLIAMLVPLTIDGALAPYWMALVARGKIAWVAAADIFVAFANVALSLFLALGLGMGLMGFALGNTGAVLAKNLVLRPLVARQDSEMPPFGPVVRLVLRAVLGGLPALTVLYTLRPQYGDSLVAVVLAGLLGGGLTLISALLASVGRAGVKGLLSAAVAPFRRQRRD